MHVPFSGIPGPTELAPEVPSADCRRVVPGCTAVVQTQQVKLAETHPHHPQKSQSEKHFHFTELAPSIRKFLKDVQEAVCKGNVKPGELANLDETAVKPFADMVRTLHFLGQKSVPGKLDDKRAKLYMLSLIHI